MFANMKSIFQFLILYLICLSPFYSQGQVDFDSKNKSFGFVFDNQKDLSIQYKYVNRGNKKIGIDTVFSNCSCLSFEWSEDDLKPGDTSIVLAKLNPAGLIGAVNKSFKVRFKKDEEIELKLQGYIKATIESPKAYFKKKIGRTRFRSNYLNIGVVHLDTIYTKVFNVYNDSDSSVTFMERMGKAEHVEVEINPMTLAPGEIGNIRIQYNTKILDELGPRSDVLTLISDENTRASVKYLNLSADIRYDFSDISEEEKKNSSDIKFLKSSHDFGNMIDGEIGEVSFKFTNTGKSELKIVQTSSSCGCTAGTSEKDSYAPGETGSIDVSFNSRNRSGSQFKYVTVYTNSALTPVTRLKISANVQKDVPEAD